MRNLRWLLGLAFLLVVAQWATAQNETGIGAGNPHAIENADALARTLGISKPVSEARRMHTQTSC